MKRKSASQMRSMAVDHVLQFPLPSNLGDGYRNPAFFVSELVQEMKDIFAHIMQLNSVTVEG